MEESFSYKHNAKGVAKKKRLVALDDFVEKCAEINFAAFIATAVYLMLRMAVWHGWIDWGAELLLVLGLSWWVALGVSLVMTVRLTIGVVKSLTRDRKEVSWANVIFAVGFGVGTWAISAGEIINFLRAMYIIISL